jgi:hypothetical protein
VLALALALPDTLTLTLAGLLTLAAALEAWGSKWGLESALAVAMPPVLAA